MFFVSLTSSVFAQDNKKFIAYNMGHKINGEIGTLSLYLRECVKTNDKS